MLASVPFYIDDIYGGLAEADGVLRLDSEFLYFDLQAKDAAFGLLKGRPVKVDVALEAIDRAEFTPPFLFRKARLTLRPSDHRVLEAIPYGKEGELVLRFRKQHGEEAARLAERLRRLLSERGIG